jgi:hypothetical protein
MLHVEGSGRASRAARRPSTALWTGPEVIEDAGHPLELAENALRGRSRLTDVVVLRSHAGFAKYAIGLDRVSGALEGKSGTGRAGQTEDAGVQLEVDQRVHAEGG